jgi:hypothetical protein
VTDEESIKHQLSEWLKGNPIHNDVRDECCPDFSCCTGEIAPLDVRQRYIKAVEVGDEGTRIQMLMMFLENSFGNSDVHIVGGEECPTDSIH